jgi:hypothetical protein
VMQVRGGGVIEMRQQSSPVIEKEVGRERSGGGVDHGRWTSDGQDQRGGWHQKNKEAVDDGTSIRIRVKEDEHMTDGTRWWSMNQASEHFLAVDGP